MYSIPSVELQSVGNQIARKTRFDQPLFSMSLGIVLANALPLPDADQAEDDWVVSHLEQQKKIISEVGRFYPINYTECVRHVELAMRLRYRYIYPLERGNFTYDYRQLYTERETAIITQDTDKLRTLYPLVLNLTLKLDPIDS